MPPQRWIFCVVNLQLRISFGYLLVALSEIELTWNIIYSCAYICITSGGSWKQRRFTPWFGMSYSWIRHIAKIREGLKSRSIFGYSWLCRHWSSELGLRWIGRLLGIWLSSCYSGKCKHESTGQSSIEASISRVTHMFIFGSLVKWQQLQLMVFYRLQIFLPLMH